MEQTRINRRGMAAMTGATSAFAINDAAMKYLVEDMAVSESVILRGIIAVIAAFVILWQARQLSFLPAMWTRPVLIRALFEAAVVVTYMQALRLMPLGLATAILQATPLMITAFAAFSGKEIVGFARWMAVLVGFVGVLFIVQPDSSGISWAMGLAILTAFFVAIRDLSNRLVPRHVPTFLIVLAASIANIVGAGLYGLAAQESWRMPSLFEVGLIVGAALFVLAATFLMTLSFRGTEVSAVSPFRYVGVPVALIIGVIIWGEAPDLLATIGIILVIGAGIFAMRDEARRAKAQSLGTSQ
jgi:drug/metabolite transporter (DMT)-like permease